MASQIFSLLVIVVDLVQFTDVLRPAELEKVFVPEDHIVGV